MRTYESTHPWLTFGLDLAATSPPTWILLGEAQSKCVHLAHVPLRPDTARHLHQVYLAKGVSATTAIEGNTLSEADVLAQIEGRLELPPSKEYLGREVQSILDACNEILSQATRGELPPLGRPLIQSYNEAILKKIPLHEEVVPGQVRRHSVGVGRYRGAPAEDCTHLLDRLCDWLNHESFTRPPEPRRIVYGILRAILTHLYIAWIHPFGDGNGRTARLVEFRILIEAGVPSPAAHLLSNHYNETRAEYYRTLDKSSRSADGPHEFIRYAVEGFVDGLREQLKVVFRQVLEVSWRDYVEDLFAEDSSAAGQRQKRLALDLSQRDTPVPVSEIRLLSARVEELYRKKTDKTVSRDIKSLIEKNIVSQTREGIRANTAAILSFTPPNAAVLQDF